MDANTRRLETNLSTLGTGTILFGLWDLIRTSLTVFVFNYEIIDMIPKIYQAITYSIIGGLSLIFFLVQLYIGMSARGESKGKRKTVIYLVLTVITISFHLLAIGIMIYEMVSGEPSGLITLIITVVIELTAITCLVEMMVNSVSLRRIRKTMKPEMGGVA